MGKLIITENEKQNILGMYGLIEEQVVTNVLNLVKDIIKFIISMKIVPGPIDGAKLLYDIVSGGNPTDVIKNYVNNKINAPGENWRRIEKDLDTLKNSKIGIEEFKTSIKNELTSLIK